MGITTKELVPVIAVVALWGSQWVGSNMCFHSDNEAVVLIIQRQHAKHIVLNQLLRCLFFYASVYHFQFFAAHIPGVNNTIADAISLDNMTLLSFLLLQASKVSVPSQVSNFLLFLQDWGSQTWIDKFSYSLSLA